MIYQKFLEVSKNTGVPVKKVLDALHALSSGKSVDNNELVRGVGVSKNPLNQMKPPPARRLGVFALKQL